jgi:hypothetical protein
MFNQCEHWNMLFAPHIYLHGPVWSPVPGLEDVDIWASLKNRGVMGMYCEVQRMLYLHGSSWWWRGVVLCCWQDISSNIITRVQHLNRDRRVIRKVLDETLQVFPPSGRGALILVEHGTILGSGKEWTQALEASCGPPAPPPTLVSSPSINNKTYRERIRG